MKDAQRYTVLWMAVSGLLIGLLRKEGIYIALPVLICAAVIRTDKKRILCIVFAVVLCCTMCINSFLEKAMDSAWSGPPDSWAFPLQMVAAYVTKYPDELSDDEKEWIDGLMTFDTIAERYNPEQSDARAHRLRRDITADDAKMMAGFIVNKFFKHPRVIVEAALNEMYGYFDPFYFYEGMSRYSLYNKGSLSESDKDVVYSEYVFSDEVRETASDAIYAWNTIPIFSFVSNPASYMWLGVLFAGALLRKREWKHMLLYAAPALTICICFISPVNGLMRYVQPVMAVSPLIVVVGMLPYVEKVKNMQ